MSGLKLKFMNWSWNWWFKVEIYADFKAEFSFLSVMKCWNFTSPSWFFRTKWGKKMKKKKLDRFEPKTTKFGRFFLLFFIIQVIHLCDRSSLWVTRNYSSTFFPIFNETLHFLMLNFTSRQNQQFSYKKLLNFLKKKYQKNHLIKKNQLFVIGKNFVADKKCHFVSDKILKSIFRIFFHTKVPTFHTELPYFGERNGFLLRTFIFLV